MERIENVNQWEKRAWTACHLWNLFHSLWWAAPLLLAGFNIHLALSGQFQTGFALVSLALAACLVALFYPRAPVKPPAGLLLPPDAFAELHAEIRAAVQAVGAPLPESVQLVPGGDLFLVHLPGTSNARFYIGIGLLPHLTRGEFCALTAQEFARNYMPARSAANCVMRFRQRAVSQLSRPDTLVHHLYLRFMTFFLDFTHPVARRQELNADALAARAMSAEALVSGLRRQIVLRPGFDAFWNTEIVPVLDAGFHPPIAQGFSMYIESAPIREIVREVTALELRRTDENESENPPPLSERIRAVQAYVSSGPPNDVRPLPISPESLESDLLDAVFPGHPRPLTPISWEELLPRVLLPHYRQAVQQQREELAGIRMDELPDGAKNPQALLERIFGGPVPSDSSPQEMRMLLGSILGPVVSAFFFMRGVKLECHPGEPVRVFSEPVPVQPFTLFDDLHAGRLKREEWLEICRRHSLHEQDLGALCEEFLHSFSNPIAEDDSP